MENSAADSEHRLSDPAGWVDEYGEQLYRFAFLRLHDRQLAEDAMQQTFLAALQGRKNFKARSSERTWLVGILKHKIIDYFRKSKKEISIEEARLPLKDNENFNASGQWLENRAPSPWDADPAQVVQEKQFREILNSCLNELPERLAQVFVLREIDDLSTVEICKLLDISESNLWVMLHRARMQLRRSLEVKYFRCCKNTS